MPQMSPLMWSNLFLFFTLLLLVTIIKIYFFTSSDIKENPLNYMHTKNHSYNWMW